MNYMDVNFVARFIKTKEEYAGFEEHIRAIKNHEIQNKLREVAKQLS